VGGLAGGGRLVGGVEGLPPSSFTPGREAGGPPIFLHSREGGWWSPHLPPLPGGRLVGGVEGLPPSSSTPRREAGGGSRRTPPIFLHSQEGGWWGESKDSPVLRLIYANLFKY